MNIGRELTKEYVYGLGVEVMSLQGDIFRIPHNIVYVPVFVCTTQEVGYKISLL